MFIRSMFCLFVMNWLVAGEVMTSAEEYVDDVINMLLNGVSGEIDQSESLDEDTSGSSEEPVLTGGIWKCGDCSHLDSARLVYTEINEVDADMISDKTVDIQIGLTVPEMKCVTVSSDVAGVVRRVAGTCSRGTVTLSVAPAQHFTVQVYN